MTLVRLTRTMATPENWIGMETKRKNGWTFPQDSIVKVIPASNLPDDSPIVYWIDEPTLANNPYGIGLYADDFVMESE